jgi:hypothetical protein
MKTINIRNYYLQILIVNVNCLNFPIKIVNRRYQKARSDHLLPTRKVSHLQKYTLSQEERVENNFPSKWTLKAGRNSYTHIQ